MKLKVEYLPTDQLEPYPNNAKLHPAEQIEQIKKSILEFGFNDPVAIWKNNEIIEGHGRVIAAKELGIDKLPVIRLDDLTDEERRGYMLVHNQLTMNTGFDYGLLELEAEELESINLEDYGFELKEWLPPEDEHDDDYDFEDDDPASLRHNVFENQEVRQYEADNWYGIPAMRPTSITGDQFLRFCDYNQIEDHENYIAHFYYDDYKFISAWREPEKYLETLSHFKAVVSPDFSLYTDFPRVLQILSCYRRQWCGRYWQERGLTVIPDVVWGDEESYDFCFLGIPKQSTVAVSMVGVERNEDWNGKEDSLFKKGYDEMLNRLEPTTILVYGSNTDGLEGNIIRIPSFYEARREMLNEMSKKNG